MGFLNIFDSYGRKKDKKTEEKPQVVEKVSIRDLVSDPTRWMTIGEDISSGKAELYYEGNNLLFFIMNNEIYQYVIVEKITQIWKDFIKTRDLRVFKDFTVPWLEEEPLHFLVEEEIPEYFEKTEHVKELAGVDNFNQPIIKEYDRYKKEDVCLKEYFNTAMTGDTLYRKFGIDPSKIHINGYLSDEYGEHIWLDSSLPRGFSGNAKTCLVSRLNKNGFAVDLISEREPYKGMYPSISKEYRQGINYLGTYIWMKEDTYDLIKIDVTPPQVKAKGVALENYSNEGAIKELAENMSKKLSSPEFEDYLASLRDKYMSRVTTILEERHVRAEKKYEEVRKDEGEKHMSEALEALAEAYADAFEAGVIDRKALEDMCNTYGINTEYVIDKSWMMYNNKYSAGEYVAKRAKDLNITAVYGMDNRIFDTNENILQKTKEDQEVDDPRSL